MNFSIEEVNKIIRHRRSIFPTTYSGEEVEQEIVEKILENATWAPTHKLTEPWRFTVFTGEGLKKLANFQSKLYKDLAGDKFDQKTFNKLANKPLDCSHVIAIGLKRNPLVPEIEEVEAVACAVQNMLLTASAYKIGAYWGTGGITYKTEAKSFFNLGEEDKLLGFLFLGKPTIEWPNRSIRMPAEEVVKWVREN